MRYKPPGISWSIENGNVTNFFSLLLCNPKMLTVGVITLTAGITFYLCQKNNYDSRDTTTPVYPTVPQNTPDSDTTLPFNGLDDPDTSNTSFAPNTSRAMRRENDLAADEFPTKDSAANSHGIFSLSRRAIPKTGPSSSFDMLDTDVPPTSTDHSSYVLIG